MLKTILSVIWKKTKNENSRHAPDMVVSCVFVTLSNSCAPSYLTQGCDFAISGRARDGWGVVVRLVVPGVCHFFIFSIHARDQLSHVVEVQFNKFVL
jgi:hypothetical protein